ncbi:lysis protein [Salmonella enterica subsp. enterica]|nr:lysis protein [Salmonella enterica subsp. enterica]EDT7315834.1 lysis protein [Salmonella enterica subsp. enterica]
MVKAVTLELCRYIARGLSTVFLHKRNTLMGIKQIFIFTLVAIFTGLAGLTGYYRLQAQAWQKETTRSMASARQQAVALSKLQAQLNVMSNLDRYYTEQLNEAENQNANLRRQLAAGTYRMRLRTADSRTVAGKNTRTCGMGNDAGIGLSADTGQDVLSLREGISRDRQKIAYLQDYIRQVCLKQIKTQ